MASNGEAGSRLALNTNKLFFHSSCSWPSGVGGARLGPSACGGKNSKKNADLSLFSSP